MAVAFTTWAALLLSLKNALADWAAGGNFPVSEYEINNGDSRRKMIYRSIDELRKGIEYAQTMADLESGTVTRRTLAKQGGNGRW